MPLVSLLLLLEFVTVVTVELLLVLLVFLDFLNLGDFGFMREELPGAEESGWALLLELGPGPVTVRREGPEILFDGDPTFKVSDRLKS